MKGLITFDHTAENALDPVIAAAVLAFGFIYIHPFVDGNGRIHRYLMHHVLARRGFNPHGVHFPVSAAILDKIGEYRSVLESYSRRLLPLAKWEATDKGNVTVLNDTGDFYRFFDATPHSEFLYACVRKTIEDDLPNETRYLMNYDQFRAGVEAMFDMPERTLSTLFAFLRQNGGRLSKRAREKEFVELTAGEVARIEELYDASVSAGRPAAVPE
jgi:Fic/DOC family